MGADEEYNEADFWRMPIGPPPPSETVPVSRPAIPNPAIPTPTAAPAVKVHRKSPPRPCVSILGACNLPRDGPLTVTVTGAAGPAETDIATSAQSSEMEAVRRQARKVEELVRPAPTPVVDLSTEEIKSRLAQFEKDFRKRHGRAVALTDARELPQPILEMYETLGRRLNPEERAQAQERMQAKEAATAQANAEAAAAAAEEQDQRAAAAKAREREWADFEANKERLFHEASSEARDQRSEYAALCGVSGRSLSGAASWVKDDEPPKPRAPTKAEYLEQARLQHGLPPARTDGPTEEELEMEEHAFFAKGGAEADLAAREERAWEQRAIAQQAHHHQAAVDAH